MTYEVNMAVAHVADILATRYARDRHRARLARRIAIASAIFACLALGVSVFAMLRAYHVL